MTTDGQTADLLVGRLLDRRYRLTALLARGGMATVYRAVDERLDRPVAVKVMSPVLADDPDFVARFAQEARSAARLSAPEVVAVFDQGRDETSGTAYLVMELVEGRDLRAVLRRHGPLPPDRALSLLEPVLRALRAAHRAGIVHHDVKPENVLLADDGRVKVADFGLARAAETSGRAATSGLVLGTVAYLAPEQIGQGTADARSDVYAAGIVLWEALTGVPPYSADTPMQVAFRHVHEDVPPPSTVVGGISPELDDLVVRATSRDPDRRPPSAAAMLAEVRALRAVQGVAPGPARTGPGLPTTPRLDTLVVPRPAGLAPLPPAGTVAGVAASDHRQAGGRPVDLAAGPGVVDHSSGAAATSVLPRPGPPGPPAPARPRRSWLRRPRRGLLGALAVLLVALLAGGGLWYVSAGRFTSAPAVLAVSQAEAQRRLQAAGLAIDLRTPQYSETVPSGQVLGQDPGPGGRVRRGGTVGVVLSRGADRRTVPAAVVGATRDAAQQALEAVGLRVGTVTQQFSDRPAGTVVSSDPAPGAQLRPQTAVALVVSRGVEQLPVPDVRGAQRADAVAQLRAAGFTVTVDEQFSDSAPAGVVTDQSPSRGDAGRGSAVALVVSKGPDVVTVPDVGGRTKDRALALLQDAGLQGRAVDLPDFGGRVYAQLPVAGASVPRGSTVTVFVS